MREVREQYEKFPYPPVGFLALPRRGQADRLAYETGMSLASDVAAIHRGQRILVAGAGTLEALVIAQAHPFAKEIVAVDISQSSINRLKNRVAWSRINDACRFRWLRKRNRLPPMRLVVADLHTWETEPFDYIIASNVLHHVDNPAALLARLSSWLNPGGLMRVMTYPKQSRMWLRWVGDWLRWHGVTRQHPDIKREAQRVIALLPTAHPIRQCYESHSETTHAAGIVDAFLHACETPLTPLAWQAACASSGLRLLGEQQHALSRSTWLTELLEPTVRLSAWQRLQILDDTLELATNPIFWLQKTDRPEKLYSLVSELDLAAVTRQESYATRDNVLSLENCSPTKPLHAGRSYYLPSMAYWQLRQGVERAQALLAQVQCTIEELLARIEQEVAHDDASTSQLILGAYSLADILKAAQPWGASQWDSLQEQGWSLCYEGQAPPGATLATQAQWLQLRHGPSHPLLAVQFQPV